MPQTTLVETTSVYRYYDYLDVLIYVGITSRGAARNGEHNKSKPWWEYVTRQEVEHFPDRQQAHAREVELIGKYAPPFNVQHNPDHRAAREVYLAFAEAAKLGRTAHEVFRSCGGFLPLTHLADGEDGHVYFRTNVDHADVALRLEWPPITRVFAEHRRSGAVQKVRTEGPFALIDVTMRNDVDREGMTIEVKHRHAPGGKSVFDVRTLRGGRR